MSRETVQITEEFLAAEKRKAAELNTQFEPPVYHRYPQPSAERYVTTTEMKGMLGTSQEATIDIAQVVKDFGPIVGDVVNSIAETHDQIKDMRSWYELFEPQDKLVANGLLNARTAYLQDLSNTVSDYLDVSSLLQTLEQKNSPEFVNIESNHE